MSALQSTDSDEALAYFDRARKHVLAVTAGLSDGQWQFKPAPDRWSIAETLEHMVVVQERILRPILAQLVAAPPPPPERDTRLLDAIVLEKIPSRAIRAKGPDAIEPAGRWTPQDALGRLAVNYQRLAGFVESRPDLREHILESPPMSIVTNGAHTTMDGYQWALAMSAHDERHIGQILEVQADPNYPRSA